MSLFLLITIIALLAVISVDVRQKRRAFLKQEQSTQHANMHELSRGEARTGMWTGKK
jgi:Tfp pilus assembly protein PilN